MKNKRFFFNNITILNGFIITSLITVFVSGLIVVIMFVRTYEEDMKDNAVTMSYQAVIQSENILDDYANQIKGSVSCLVSKGYEDEQNYAQTMIEARNDIVSISMYDEEGNMLNCFTGKEELKKNTNNNLSHPDNFNNDEGVQLSKPHVATIFEGYYPWVISVYSITKDSAGNKITIVMDILFSEIVNSIRGVSIGEHGYCYIMGQDGDLIYHPHQQLVNTGAQMNIANHDEGVYVENEVIYTVSNLQNVEWKIVGVCYVDEMINEKVKSVAFVIIVCEIIVLLATLLLLYSLGGYIADPVKELIVSMRNFEENAENFEYKKISGMKEISMLSDSFGLMVERIQSLMREVRNEEITLRKTELKALQAQINPHFLYNTLDAIAWMCEDGNNEEAGDMVTALASLFRISISKGHELITIDKEIQHAMSYLKIEKLRYKNKFNYNFDIEESCLKYYCNKITLQPIIENAIYHGVNQMVDEGIINIRIYSEGEDIIFKVSDNGVGMTKEECERIFDKSKNESTGIGVINVDERVKIYFGSQYGVEIYSEVDEGTTVTIRMPKIIQEDDYEK